MEEQQKLTSPEAPKERGKTWMVFLTFIAILAAMTVFAIVFRSASGKLDSPDNVRRPEVMLSDEPYDPESMTPTPTVLPTQTADTPAPTHQAFLKTAIVINGKRYAVLSSLQAAEDLMMNVSGYFENMLPVNAVTELVTDVELKQADQNDETTDYDSAFSLFTGENTPLRFVSKVATIEDGVLSHKDNVHEDSSIQEGMRIVNILGRDGVERRMRSDEYVNGVLSKKGETETYTVMEPIDGDISVGTMKVLPGYKGDSDYGDMPNIGEYVILDPPVKGKIIRYFGPTEESFHPGIDIQVPAKTQATAACKGVVVSVVERGALGIQIEIQHDKSVTTRYARIYETNVSVGDLVMAGDAIGSIKSADTVAYLHFELRVDGIAYNPLKILSENDIKA